MDREIEAMFSKMGARVRSGMDRPTHEMARAMRKRRLMVKTADVETLRIDVQRDDYGEIFDLRSGPEVRIEVPDCDPADKHLLLLAHQGRFGGTQTFLCGRDERSWFVAAIPESANVHSVQGAKDALKPREVWDAMQRFGVPMERRDRRRTAAFARQGEWFFIPRPNMNVADRHVLHNEPIRRGAGKAHMCEFLHRVDGERVRVNDLHPNGVTAEQFAQLSPSEKQMRWKMMARGARVFARGAIRHPDHNTIWLTIWHQVVMNTETQARAMQHVAFLD